MWTEPIASKLWGRKTTQKETRGLVKLFTSGRKAWRDRVRGSILRKDKIHLSKLSPPLPNNTLVTAGFTPY